MFSLFNFSPHTVEAIENEEIEEQEEEVSQDANEDTENPEEDKDQESESSQEELSDHPNSHDEKVQNDKDLNTSSLNKKSSDEPKLFTQGDSGDHVIELKKNLTLLGFGNFPSSPSKNYGSVTEGVVKDFQKANNLSLDGVAGKSTLAKIEELLSKPLEYTKGDSGDHVIELKKNLTLLGFGNFPSSPSKNYGSVTEGVVKDFQKANNLSLDGVAGKSTLAKIEELLTKPSDYTKGDSGDHVIELKKNLTLLGFGNFPSSPSKNYGSVTEGVVKDFQKANNLSLDGVAGKSTLAKIEELLTKPSDYTKGDSGDHVIELKKNLTLLGFGNFPSSPSKNYGSVTEGVVKDFQKANNLPVDGVAGKSTLAKIEELLTKPSDYTLGDSGDHVIELKKNVTLLGFGNFPSSPSKHYGNVTEGVVKDFQKDNKLPVDGVAGKSTLAKIEELLTKSHDYTVGDSGDHVVKLKENLTLLGFGSFPSSPSKNYGSVTEGVVKDFQLYYGLKVTGNGDKKTLEKIDSLTSSSYQNGEKGTHVVKLKEDLTQLGFNFPENPSKTYGDVTEKKVREFQKHYGLTINGIADEETLAKIESLISSSYKNGEKGTHVVKLKEDLTQLGFGFPKNPSKSYGDVTEKRVRELQKHYNLKVNGIADDNTLEKIDEILSSTYRNGKKGSHVVTLKKNLTILGYNFPKSPSKSYGNVTEGKVKEFQKDYGLPVSGIADDITLAAIDKAVKEIPISNEKTTYTNYNLTLKQAIDKQMGRSPQTDKYRNDPAYISAAYVEFTSSGARTTASVNIRSQGNASSHIYATVPKGTSVNITKRGSSWHTISFGSWRNPTRSDVQAYVDPDKNDRYQHLLLTSSVGVKASELNKTLVGKGKLSGQGQAFIDGAKKHSVNEAYLISHAILETGHGSSTLAKGVRINGVTVYNMFGIGAYDSCPVQCGAQYAYDKGWTTPYKAIVGGAEFIGRDYVHNQYEQNTLYKMRWNHVYAPKQYATDIGWAVKQVSQIKRIYQQLDNPYLHFDKPKFK